MDYIFALAYLVLMLCTLFSPGLGLILMHGLLASSLCLFFTYASDNPLDFIFIIYFFPAAFVVGSLWGYSLFRKERWQNRRGSRFHAAVAAGVALTAGALLMLFRYQGSREGLHLHASLDTFAGRTMLCVACACVITGLGGCVARIRAGYSVRALFPLYGMMGGLLYLHALLLAHMDSIIIQNNLLERLTASFLLRGSLGATSTRHVLQPETEISWFWFAPVLFIMLSPWLHARLLRLFKRDRLT